MAVAAQDETRVRRAGDDLFLAAGEIDWRSETSGDALVAGGEIDLRGDIHGAAVVAGGRRTVASKIDQDGLRAFAVCAECHASRHANPAHKIVAGAGARDTRSSRCADCGGSALGDGDRRSPGADCTGGVCPVDAAGLIAAAAAIGDLLLDRFSGGERASTAQRVLALIAALLALFLLINVPYAGGLLVFIAMLFGIGAIVLALFSPSYSGPLQAAA